MPIARKGKLAACPLSIREEVNRRLLDGESGPKILAWLNAQAEVRRVLDERFGGFQDNAVSPQNLSEWRQGGYAEWLERRDKVEATKALASFAGKLGEAAGGSLTDGSAAILGSKILETLEAGNLTAEEMAEVAKALVALRHTDLEARKAAQRDRLLAQKERTVALSEKQFQVRSCELFVKWAEDKRAREILEGKGRRDAKIDQLRELMFGREEAADETPDGDTQDKG
ncbi:MAG: hypothetical protein FJ399_08455 [Verrucomicrobia bacterium]|nr:hypothetical protein [Verrucomicrobiota bacterium]